MLGTEEIILRLFLSVMTGSLIGFEREYRNKSAGFRTIILICLGSCVFTLVSIIYSNGQSDRIAANIVTGIGFIGGGVIFKSAKGVNGITTAATIWITAAMGMSLGAGMYLTTLISLALALVILSLLHWLENKIEKINHERNYKIVLPYKPSVLEHYEKMIHAHHLRYKRLRRTRDKNTITASWKVGGSQKRHDQFVEAMLKDDSLTTFTF